MPGTALKALMGSLAAVLLCAAPLRAGEVTPARTYLILVGISSYSDKQIKPRPRAEADAKALYDLFTAADSLGIAPDRVRLLLGTADPRRSSRPATRANLLDALAWVVREAGPDDLVLFAFFGQGAPLDATGERLGYFAQDTTVPGRSKNAVSAAEVAKHLDKLKSRRFCAFVDVNFNGFSAGNEASPAASLGDFAYREFRGEGGLFNQPAVAGRVVFLATNGLKPSLDRAKHGLFAQVILDGLKGAADKEGYEPDGLVTVGELATYLTKELPRRAARLGTTKDEKAQQPFLLSGPDSRFALTHNPAAAPQLRERLARLERLAKAGDISGELAAEGRRLLGRMPRFAGQQALRKAYQALADGTRSAAEFNTGRIALLRDLTLKRADALAFARKVLAAAELVRNAHIKEAKLSELAAGAVRGLYRRAEEPLPKELAGRLDQAADLQEDDLIGLVADARTALGKREDLDGHKDLDFALHQMLVALDPRNVYIDPAAVAQFRRNNQLRLTGIGVQARKDPATGELLVVTPIRGGPSYKQGIQSGDQITTVTRAMDGEGTPLDPPEVLAAKDFTLNELIQKLLGKAGTRVKLTVRRAGAPKLLEFDIVRGVVAQETVLGIKRTKDDSWDYSLDAQKGIAYVRVTALGGNVVRDLKAALTDLTGQGVKGVILDLRFNPGGTTDNSFKVADLFIDDGLIVTARARGGKEQRIVGKSADSFLKFPLVCLVNGETSSGAEIVAACLQDHKRAALAGERSNGRGIIENLRDYDGGVLRFTTALFYRPSGKNIDKGAAAGKDVWGVVPEKGLTLNLSRKERADLLEHLRRLEVIPPRGRQAEAAPAFADRQLELALRHLRGMME